MQSLARFALPWVVTGIGARSRSTLAPAVLYHCDKMKDMEKTASTPKQPRKETEEKMQGITRSEFLNMLSKAAKNGHNGNGSKNGKHVPK
jgi:hypothetical protein